ncbi:MAG: O-antigen ligase family protein [Flammeovirgaceae bacterium]|nr:O-antigen ligase family protein [Flammeovirgaceae bacterium]
MYVTITQSNYLNDRIATLFTSDISAIDGGKETGLSIRIVKWKCSLVGIMEAPFFGTGTGDAVDYLVSCYEKENFWGQYPQYRFNSHNQYLETTLTLGITGLISLMGCLVLPFRLAIKRRDYQLLSCIALFSFCCLTESLLERQWGIVFLTFCFHLSFDEN